MARSKGTRLEEEGLEIPAVSWDRLHGIFAALGCGQSLLDLAANPEMEHQAAELLAAMGFFDLGRECVTKQGLAYLVARDAQDNAPDAKEMLADGSKRLRAARLICSVLRGRSVKLANVMALLRLHGWNGEGGRTRVYHLLQLLNEAGLVAYSKKNDRLRVIWTPDGESDAVRSVFISPSTPYSNLKRARELLKQLCGEVVWVDKHFDRKAFDLIVEAFEAPKVKRITLLSGPANCDSRARADYARVQVELRARGIEMVWRLLGDDTARGLHDRWILDDRRCWNVPPVNSLFKGQASEMLQSSARPDIDTYIRASVPV